MTAGSLCCIAFENKHSWDLVRLPAVPEVGCFRGRRSVYFTTFPSWNLSRGCRP